MKKKENNKINSITRKYISERSVSEIDFDLYSEILGKDWSEVSDKLGRFEDFKLNDSSDGWSGDSHPINIDRTIKILESLKKKGCNFVEIMYHCDHIGYYFYGLNIHRSTATELQDHYSKEKKNAQKDRKKKITELENELQFLKKQDEE